MGKTFVYYGIMLLGVLIAVVSQIMLKKAADRQYDKWYKQYLNALVIVGYGLMVLSTLCSVVAYRVVPLSSAPLWSAAAQVFIVVLSFLFLGERPGKKKMAGLLIVAVGAAVFCL